MIRERQRAVNAHAPARVIAMGKARDAQDKMRQETSGPIDDLLRRYRG